MAGAGLLVALAAYLAVALSRPIPGLTLAVTGALPHAFPARAEGVAWPAQGQAAVAVEGVGLMGSRDAGRPQPIASVAKVMTAVIVLRDHPLALHADGPEITVTRADVDTYEADRDSGQSTATVVAGEELTERQALEGLLLPSANNLATLLARWDAGSEDAFVERMNAEARGLGMSETHYADASGFSTSTVSTALDQTRLASTAIRVPALAQIVALPEAELPVAGTLRNLDALLDSNGVVGVKTGSTSAAGGCFVFAARIREAGREAALVGAVLGQPGVGEFQQLASAFDAASLVLRSARRQLVPLTRVLRGRRFGELQAAWTGSVPVGLVRSLTRSAGPGCPCEFA